MTTVGAVASTVWDSLDAAPDALVVVDAGGTISFANRGFEEVFVCARAEAVGALLERFVAERSRAALARQLDSSLATAGGRPAEPLELVALRPGGEELAVAVSLRAVERDGAAMAVISFRELPSVVSHRGAEPRNLSGALDAIMEYAPAFIFAIDPAGRIEFANRGIPPQRREDVVGSDWLRHLPAEDRDRRRALLRRVLSTGQPETFETTLVGPDGGTRWFTMHLGPMRQGDAVVGAILVSQEVTDVKRIQVDAAAAYRMAAVGTLAAGIAHEVNTPVQFVNDSVHFVRDAARDLFGLLDKLQEVRRLAGEGGLVSDLHTAIAAVVEDEEAADLPYLQENVPRALERCIDGLERIANIVRSMKEFAHPSQHVMAPVDLNRAIQNTLTIARNEYKYVAELRTELGELPPVVCHVDELNQVVLNLVVNAAHAIGDVVKDTDKKGVLTVRTRADGDDVVISIADTGTGIPPAIAGRIFEPFFTTKEVGRGTGQGLAMAWTTVTEKHGGQLTFETKAGEGTTFFIRLPIAGKGGKSVAEER